MNAANTAPPRPEEKRRFKLTLLQRMALALAAVSLLPLAVAVYQIELGRQSAVERAQMMHLAVVRAAAHRVGDYLELLGNVAASGAQNPTLFQTPSSPTAQAALRDLLLAWPDLVAAGLFLDGPNGPELVQRVQDPAYADAVTALFADVTVATAGAVPLALEDAAGQAYLRLRAEVPETPLMLYLLARSRLPEKIAVAAELGADAEVVLCDPSGRVLAGEADFEEFPVEVRDIVTSGQPLAGAQEYLAGPRQRVIAAYADVVGSDWMVLSKQPAVVVEQAISSMRSIAGRAFGIVALGLIGLVVAAQRGIVRPIRELAAAHRRLLGASAQVGNGEIDDLRASFAELEKRIYDRDALGEVFLGRYQIRGILGSGAMGTVFRGYDPKLERPVALKTFKLGDGMVQARGGHGEAGMDGDAEGSNAKMPSLLREAVTLARLRHTHIVTVFDAVGDADTAFIAMELVDGHTLERHLGEGPLEVSQAVTLGVAIARALEAAHAEKIVHHDVKPANILLGADGAIKVSDFGISQLVNPGTEVDAVFGTPGYLAPEALYGEGYREASDLFALGVVLYECLTGRSPFYADTTNEVLAKTLRGNITPLQQVNPRVPEDVSELVTQLLDSEPEARPASATEVAEKLEALVLTEGWRWQPRMSSPGEGGRLAPTLPVIETRRRSGLSGLWTTGKLADEIRRWTGD